MRQIPLPLYKDEAPQELIITSCNEAIFNRLSLIQAQENVRLLLIGDSHSGKKLFGRYFKQNCGGLYVDHADTLSDNDLFFLWNQAHDEQRPLLFSSARQVGNWDMKLPDLQSRIASMELLSILPPDDELIAELIKQKLLYNDIAISSKAFSYSVKRIERSYTMIYEFIVGCVRIAKEENSAIKLGHVKSLL